MTVVQMNFWAFCDLHPWLGTLYVAATLLNSNPDDWRMEEKAMSVIWRDHSKEKRLSRSQPLRLWLKLQRMCSPVELLWVMIAALDCALLGVMVWCFYHYTCKFCSN